MNALYAEVIASVLAAGVLGLGCGWMLQRGRAARTLKGTIATWEKRYDALRDGTGNDTDELETRLQVLGGEVRDLTARNRELETTVAERETALETARSDAIELNRRQARVQQKLQALLQRRNADSGRSDEASTRDAPAVPERIDAEATRPEADDAPRRRRDAEPAQARVKDDHDVEAYIDRLGHRGDRDHRGTDDEPDAPKSTRDAAPARPVRTPRATPAETAQAAQAARAARAARPTRVRDVAVAAVPIAHAVPARDEGTLDATVLMDRDADEETATLVLDPVEFIDSTLEDDSTVAFDDATLARVRRRSYE